MTNNAEHNQVTHTFFDPVDEELYEKALLLTADTGLASTASLQQKLNISYRIAALIIDRMESCGYIGPKNSTNPRRVYADRIRQRDASAHRCERAMSIYLDIDGVLIDHDMKAARYADEFIAYVLSKYPDTTYWLTTRCQGDAVKTVNGIADLFKEETIKLLHQIKPTAWLDSPLKASAIDYSHPFLWFDDYPFDADKRALFDRGVLDNWIEVDLENKPGQLKDFIEDFPTPINVQGDNVVVKP